MSLSLTKNIVLIAGASLIAAAFALPFARESKEKGIDQTLRQCFRNAISPAKQAACLRVHIKNFLTASTSAPLLEIVKASPIKEVSHSCHFIGHIAGQELYKKTGSAEAALKACSRECTYSCVHGAIAEAVIEETGFRPERALQLLHAKDRELLLRLSKKYCKTSGPCHGVGHAFFVMFQDFQTSLALCEAISKRASLEHCYRGIFMENSGLRSSHQFDGKTPEPIFAHGGDYAYPCNAVDPKYHDACFRYQPRIQQALFQKSGILGTNEQFTVQKRICESFPLPYSRRACIEGLGYAKLDIAAENPDAARAYCEQFETVSDKNACMLGAVLIVAAYYYDEKGPDYCVGEGRASSRTLCYNIVFQATGIYLARKELSQICEKAQQARECLQELERYKKEAATLPDFTSALPQNMEDWDRE